MFNGPLGSGIQISMPKDKRIDLLLQLFQCQLMVIPHPEILFDCVIFSGWDIDRMISAVAQALRNQMCIPLIRFDPLSLRGKHGRRRENDTFDPGAHELMIKGITEAACLVTAFNRIMIKEAQFHLQGFNEANDFFVIRSNLNLSENPVFCSDRGFHCT